MTDAPWCYVIAFNRREYLQWCFDHGYDFQRPDWVYAPDPQWLRKHTQHAEPGYRYMLTARAHQRRDWEQMQYRLDEDAALRVNPDGSWHLAEPLEETWDQFSARVAADPDMGLTAFAHTPDHLMPTEPVPQEVVAAFDSVSGPVDVNRLRTVAARMRAHGPEEITATDAALLSGDPAPLRIIVPVEIEEPPPSA